MKRLSAVCSLFLFLTLHSAAAHGTKIMETVRMEEGWHFEVTRSVGMQGTESYQNGYQAPFRIFQKIQFNDQVIKTDGKVIQEVNRTIETAELNSLDPESGQMLKQEIIPAGSRFRVSHTPYGSTLFDGNSYEEIWEEETVSAFSPPIVPNLWPQGMLRKGQKWSYRGNELTARIALLDIIGGEIELGVEDIEEEPSTHLMTALIRGKLQTKVDLGNIVMDFNADVSIDLPIRLGIPFMVKFDGTLLGSGTAQDQYGQPISFQAQASGTYVQIAKPSDQILASIDSGIGAKTDEMAVIVEKGRIDDAGAIRLPLNNDKPSRSVSPSKKGEEGLFINIDCIRTPQKMRSR